MAEEITGARLCDLDGGWDTAALRSEKDVDDAAD